MAELRSSDVLAKITSTLKELQSNMPTKHTIELNWSPTREDGVYTDSTTTQFLNDLYNNPELNIVAMFCPDVEATTKHYIPLSSVFKTSTYLYLEFVDPVEFFVWDVRYQPVIGFIVMTKDNVSAGDWYSDVGSKSSLVIYSF